jgi:hypothetical protein
MFSKNPDPIRIRTKIRNLVFIHFFTFSTQYSVHVYNIFNFVAKIQRYIGSFTINIDQSSVLNNVFYTQLNILNIN